MATTTLKDAAINELEWTIKDLQSGALKLDEFYDSFHDEFRFRFDRGLLANSMKQLHNRKKREDCSEKEGET